MTKEERIRTTKTAADLYRLEVCYRELVEAIGWHIYDISALTEDHKEVVNLARYLRESA